MGLDEAGFELLEGSLPATLLGRLEAALASSDPGRAGLRFLMARPEIAAIARDERLLAIAGSALGQGARPFRATLFAKSTASNWLVAWHQDRVLPLAGEPRGPGWTARSLKGGRLHMAAPARVLERVLALRIHLDDCDEEGGALRVVPGSHRAGVLAADEIADLVAKGRARTVAARRGDVLAFAPLLLHASSRMLRPGRRRILHVEYAADLEIEPGAELALC